MCAQKATSFHKALGMEREFDVSTEWLARLNQWYSIHETDMQGQTLNFNDTASNSLHMDFQKSA